MKVSFQLMEFYAKFGFTYWKFRLLMPEPIRDVFSPIARTRVLPYCYHTV